MEDPGDFPDSHVVRLNGPVVMVHKGWSQANRRVGDDSSQGTLPHAEPARSMPFQSSASLRNTRDGSKPANQTRNFAFINDSVSWQRKDPAVRSLIRRHVVKETNLQKQRSRPSRNTCQGKATRESHHLQSSNPEYTSMRLSDSNEVEIPFELNRSPMSDFLDPHPRLSSQIREIDVVSSAMYPLETKLNCNPLGVSSWFDWVCSDDALFNALMYTTYTYGGLLKGSAESRDAIARMNDSVKLVNHRLSSSPVIIDDGTIGAVSCLGISEAFRGNSKGWDMHMRGMSQMIRARGGISAISETLRQKLYRVDLVGAIDFLMTPHFDFQCYHSSSPTTTGSHLRELEMEGEEVLPPIIRPDLQVLFAEIRRFSHTLEHMLKNPKDAVNDPGWLDDGYRLRYELVALTLNHTCEHENESLNEAFRIGALMFLKRSLEEYPFSAVGAQNLVCSLRQSLMQTTDYGRVGSQILWLLFMGGISSRNRLDRTWYTAELIKVTRSMELLEWTHVVPVLEKMPWIGSIYESPCKRLWEEIPAPVKSHVSV